MSSNEAILHAKTPGKHKPDAGKKLCDFAPLTLCVKLNTYIS